VIAPISGSAHLESDLLRVKAVRLIENIRASVTAAEALLHLSLDTAQRQGQLGSSMSLASLWQEQARIRLAHELLESIRARLSEGFDTAVPPGADP
jgi:hypothetical protein